MSSQINAIGVIYKINIPEFNLLIELNKNILWNIYCSASNQHANNKQFRSFVTHLHYDSDAKIPLCCITP